MFNFKKVMSGFISILVLFNMLTIFELSDTVSAQENERMAYYISLDGNDSNDGTIDKPFATLEKARDAIRELKKNNNYPAKGVTVYLRGGTYVRNKSFVLDEKDSGMVNGPIVYRAYGNEDVKILGGASLTLSDFKPVTDKAILSRLPNESKDKVQMVDLKAKGITEFGELPLYGHSMFFLKNKTKYKEGTPAPELFFNNKVMTLSRWPNEDYVNVDSVVEQGDVIRLWMDDYEDGDRFVPLNQRNDPPKGFVIKLADDRIKRWAEAKDMWLYGYWHNNFSDQSMQVASIDIANKEIASIQPSAYGVKRGQRFYVYNLLEEIDIPGEWYLDRSSGILYFYPPEGDKNTNIQISLMEDTMIKMNKASNIVIKNIYMGISRLDAIQMENGENNIIENCTISKFGSLAITITGGKNNGVINCTIYDTGAGGIRLDGGDRKTLTPAGHYAENNHIYNYARIEKTYKPAVWTVGVGNRASYNKIHDGAHTAILFSGNDHIIEYNEIFDVAKETDDMSAIYAGRSWTSRGNIIRYNYMHNIKGYTGGTHRVSGIYLDDGISGTHMYGNVFYNVAQGLLINGGRDNIAENNMFINLDNVMRGTDLSEAYKTWAAASWPTLNKGLEDVPYKEEPWKSKYPNLVKILEDQPEFPKHNVVKNNLIVNSPLTFDKGGIVDNFKKFGTIDKNIEIKNDVGFVDVSKSNFKLKDNSVVFKEIPEFKNIPFEKIGRYSDKVKDRISDAVVLFIGSPYSVMKNDIKQVDSQNVDVMPIIKDGRTLVPVRFIAESYGAEVGWDGATSKVSVNLGGKVIEMQLGSKKIIVDGNESELDVPAQVINERTLIPLRAMVEAIGKKVFWDPRGLIIMSDRDNIFDSSSEQILINEVISKVSAH